MKITYIVLSFSLLLFSNLGIAENKLPSLETFNQKLSDLIKAYYPEAKITFTQNDIHFEYKVREFVVHDLQKNGTWSIPFTRLGPDRDGWQGQGGILGDISLFKGQYFGSLMRPQTIDYHYYKTLLLAPYSKKYNCNLNVDLLYPDTVDLKFVEKFTALINGFENTLN